MTTAYPPSALWSLANLSMVAKYNRAARSINAQVDPPSGRPKIVRKVLRAALLGAKRREKIEKLWKARERKAVEA